MDDAQSVRRVVLAAGDRSCVGIGGSPVGRVCQACSGEVYGHGAPGPVRLLTQLCQRANLPVGEERLRKHPRGWESLTLITAGCFLRFGTFTGLLSGRH